MMRQGVHIISLLLEDDPAHAEAVQRAFLDSGMKAEVQVARTLREYRALAAAHICRDYAGDAARLPLTFDLGEKDLSFKGF